MVNKKIITKDQFIEISKKTHIFEYDYSLLPETMGIKDKVWLICKKHGKFDELKYVKGHLDGHECKKCILEKRSIDKLNPTKIKNFFDKCRKLHKNSDGTPKYIYDESTYKGETELIDVYCPIHDYHFKPRGNMHAFVKEPRGCKYCGYDSMKKELSLSQEVVIERLKKLFPNFTFEKTFYDGCGIHSDYLIITCPIHGDFQQYPKSSLMGKCGCDGCKNQHVSVAEAELYNYIKSIYSGKILQNTRDVINPKEIDIYLPDKKLAIEYDGLYWHSDYKRDNNYHLLKTEKCLEKGIQLIHIFEDEWSNKKEIVKSRLSNIINNSKYRIFARKCSIRQLSVSEEKNFLNKNHIQGYVNSSICYGLIYDYNGTEVILGCMSFGPLRKNLGLNQEDGVYEMYRFCNQINFTVVGGASKLFKHFLKKYNPQKIISYADRRWSNGNLYNKLGFVFEKTSIPNYFYVDNYGTRHNRYEFRKDKLITKYGADPNKSENQITFEMGLSKIYDCGTLKYIFINNLETS